jgi:hypothetical protein
MHLHMIKSVHDAIRASKQTTQTPSMTTHTRSQTHTQAQLRTYVRPVSADTLSGIVPLRLLAGRLKPLQGHRRGAQREEWTPHVSHGGFCSVVRCINRSLQVRHSTRTDTLSQLPHGYPRAPRAHNTGRARSSQLECAAKSVHIGVFVQFAKHRTKCHCAHR